jgi:hypothetical protein
MKVENLRSPYGKVQGLCYFGRMIDKIRLYADGRLPSEYHPNLGGGFDERCCSFLWIEYPALVERVKRSDEEIEVWNEFMRKRGWNDEASERLQQRVRELGLGDRPDIQTFFDFIDADEGRK